MQLWKNIRLTVDMTEETLTLADPDDGYKPLGTVKFIDASDELGYAAYRVMQDHMVKLEAYVSAFSTKWAPPEDTEGTV